MHDVDHVRTGEQCAHAHNAYVYVHVYACVPWAHMVTVCALSRFGAGHADDVALVIIMVYAGVVNQLDDDV